MQALDYNLMRGPTLRERIERLANDALVIGESSQELLSLWNYLGRMVMFDYDLLNAFSESEIAVAVLWVSIQASEQRFNKRISYEGLEERLSQLSGVSASRLGKCVGAVQDLEEEFGLRFHCMGNLEKHYGVKAVGANSN